MKRKSVNLSLLLLVWLLVLARPVNYRRAAHPAAAAPAAPVWSLLFADDFERGTDDWLLDGDWEIQTEDSNRVLHGSGFAFAHSRTAPVIPNEVRNLPSTEDDYSVEARVRVHTGEAKIALRVDQQHAGYYLDLEAGGELRLQKWDGAQWSLLGSDAGPYPADTWYTLALRGEGTHLQAYVDEEPKIEADDADDGMSTSLDEYVPYIRSAYVTGKFLLAVAPGEADFDDVWVVGDAPAACPVVPSNGLNAPFGIAFDARGEMLVASATRVSRVTQAGEVSFFASAGAPGDLAIDGGGNLYVVAEEVKTIYKIAPDGTRSPFVTSLKWPWYLAMGPDGYLYASDAADVVRIDLSNGSAELWLAGLAGDMVFDGAGNAYVLSRRDIRRITPGKVVSVVAELPELPAYKGYCGLARDAAGNLYVGEALTLGFQVTDLPQVPAALADQVYKVTPGGAVSTFAQGLGGVWDMAFGPDGYLYVTEHDLNGLSRIAPDGTVSPVVPRNGLSTAADVAYGPDGALYFISLENTIVARLNAGGEIEPIGSRFCSFSGHARGPALAFNAAGALFVAEACPNGPQRITRIAGAAATTFTEDVQGPSGLAFGAGGDLYVSEGPPGNLVRFSSDGVRHPVASGLNQPQGLAFGPQGLLHVAEIGGNRVSQVDSHGTITSFVTVTAPIDLAFAGADLLVSTETGALWRAAPDGTAALFAQGPGNAAGITLAPDGSVVAAFGADNSIYRFTDGGTTPGVDLTAPASAFGRSGQTITHTFTLRNAGNGQDGFRLSATSERGWPLSILGGVHVGPLHCGQTHAVRVAVTVPPGTALGITDTLVLAATSRLDADVLASPRVTTISGYLLYLPITLR